MKKYILSLIIFIFGIFFLASCDKKSNSTAPTDDSQTQPSKDDDEDKPNDDDSGHTTPQVDVYFDVIFNSNGGSSIENQRIKSGGKVNRPENPLKKGYEFDGWYYKGEKWNFTDSVVTENITFEASWIEPRGLSDLIYRIDENNDYIVTGVKNLNIKNIIVPDIVIEISAGAFANCSSLESITIPNSITSIGLDPFANCYSLTNVYYDGTIEDWCNISFKDVLSNPMATAQNFYILDKNGNIKYNGKNYKLLTELEIPSTIKSIGNYQFLGFDDLISVIIGNGVTTIGEKAFICYSLVNITIGKNVTSIAEQAFDGEYSLTNVYYDGTIEDWCNYKFNTSGQTPMDYETNFYILDDNGDIEYNGKNYKLLTELVIPSTVTLIGSFQFFGFSNLINVTIPNSVISIGIAAFYYCSSLKSIVIPNSVTSIGGNAFANCSSMESITIPNSITSIDIGPFASCSSLDNVYYDGTIESWCNISFNDVGSNPMDAAQNFYILDKNGDIEYNGKNYKLLTELIIPSIVTSIGNSQFNGFGNLTNVTIPNSVTTIGKGAFEGCSSLESITIPNSITSIRDSTFDGCSSLESITIPNSVTSIGREAFYRCSSLENVIIGNSVLSIGTDAFRECSSLESITIPNSVTTIGSYAFYYCSLLKSIVIPNSVTNIGSYALNYCSSLKNVYFLGNQEEFNSIIISNDISYLTDATIYYYSENEPQETGNYWHYVDGVVTIWN